MQADLVTLTVQVLKCPAHSASDPTASELSQVLSSHTAGDTLRFQIHFFPIVVITHC